MDHKLSPISRLLDPSSCLETAGEGPHRKQDHAIATLNAPKDSKLFLFPEQTEFLFGFFLLLDDLLHTSAVARVSLFFF